MDRCDKEFEEIDERHDFIDFSKISVLLLIDITNELEWLGLKGEHNDSD